MSQLPLRTVVLTLLGAMSTSVCPSAWHQTQYCCIPAGMLHSGKSRDVNAHAGHFCEGCACRNCQNVEANEAVVMHMRQQILARSPNAFDVKVADSCLAFAVSNTLLR